jgi:RecA-family ATPase
VAADPEAQLDRRLHGILTKLDAKRQIPSARMEAYRLTEEDEPDHDWLIPGFIERQGRILIAGAEGSGKSLMALTLAVQAASGLPVLGRFPMSIAARVVYLDLEMGRSSTRRRLRQLLISAKGSLIQGDFYIYHRPDGLDLSTPTDRAELDAWFNEIEPELVIIDPLYKMSLTDSTYEREVKPTLKMLDRWRLVHGCGIILVHHFRKRPQGEAGRGRDASDVFGSSVLLRWPETVFMLNEETLKLAKDREATFADLKSFQVVRGGQWPISLDGGAVLPTEEVFDHIRVSGPCSGNSVALALGRRRTDVYNALRSLEKDNRIFIQSGRWAVTS